ncbi:hypothetical protein KEU06_23460 [Pseudaminobacter sp. 19-2017]|uniref:Efflux transporter periplasmic adaptor subunit n=1 Tax=Pseudaminobacter soli (ex Zhang et al. 2022) TaxID=2831468 RepID=A0A942E5H9_9HYPH|nr:hypothetical protein [Pseudaminobacter soli]MBS3651580.1 hypothetical protein [Pseudaminobacter soli]
MKLYRGAMVLGFVVVGLTWSSLADAEQHQHSTGPAETEAANERPAAPASGESPAKSDTNPAESAVQMSSHAPVVFTLRTGHR